MNVNAVHRTESTTPASLIRLALTAGAGAALVAVLLAGRIPEPVIIVGIILISSLFGWRRTLVAPARVRSYHRFTVVSRFDGGFVTIDSAGARRVARRMVLGGPPR